MDLSGGNSGNSLGPRTLATHHLVRTMLREILDLIEDEDTVTDDLDVFAIKA